MAVWRGSSYEGEKCSSAEPVGMRRKHVDPDVKNKKLHITYVNIDVEHTGLHVTHVTLGMEHTELHVT